MWHCQGGSRFSRPEAPSDGIFWDGFILGNSFEPGLVGGSATPLKNMSSSSGMMRFPTQYIYIYIYGNIKSMLTKPPKNNDLCRKPTSANLQICGKLVAQQLHPLFHLGKWCHRCQPPTRSPISIYKCHLLHKTAHPSWPILSGAIHRRNSSIPIILFRKFIAKFLWFLDSPWFTQSTALKSPEVETATTILASLTDFRWDRGDPMLALDFCIESVASEARLQRLHECMLHRKDVPCMKKKTAQSSEKESHLRCLIVGTM